MRYRRLGETELLVSEIGFGCWGIGGGLWRGGDDGEALRALHGAVSLGINFFDTALGYGEGHSERLLGRLFRETPEPLLVATKVPPRNRRWPAQGPLQEVFPVDYVKECVEQSLRNLGRERLDLLQLHVWDPNWLQESAWSDLLEALHRLREGGKIRYWGVSTNDHQPDSVLTLVHSGAVSSVQVIYNIFEQAPRENLFPACGLRKVGVIVRVPFDEGALTGSVGPRTRFPKKDWRNFYFRGNRKEQVARRLEPLRQLCLRHPEQVGSLAELALRFCLQPQEVATVIPGMRRLEHVVQNARVSGLPPLSPELVQELHRHAWPKNFYR